MYRKVEWAKRVITIWKQNVKYDMKEPYPALPPERHLSEGARRARSRGGKARAAAIRRKHGSQVKTEKREKGSVEDDPDTGSR